MDNTGITISVVANVDTSTAMHMEKGGFSIVRKGNDLRVKVGRELLPLERAQVKVIRSKNQNVLEKTP